MSNVDLEVSTDDPSVDLPPLPGSKSDKPRLDLSVEISDAGPCRKRLKVAISRGDIDREFSESLKNLRKEAQVPGFRPGKAPAQLVERRFRGEISDQVKGKLLVSCIEQLDQDYQLNPLSTPDLDINAIVLPPNGPMTFEMELEVAPDFELADYKGLSLKRPQGEVAPDAVDARIAEIFESRYGQLAPKTEGDVAIGDGVVADFAFALPDGATIEKTEIEFRLRDSLEFADVSIPKIGEALAGAKTDETRETEFLVADNAEDPALRGHRGTVRVKVLDLKQVRTPEITPEFVQSMDFASIEDFRESVEASLKSRLDYLQTESLQRQAAEHLLSQSQFEIPQELLIRQAEPLLARQLESMRNAGCSNTEIQRAKLDFIRNPDASVKRMLSEYFLLSRIATTEKVETSDADVNDEIQRTADATGESARRVRARLEKDNQIEGLTSLIQERKTLQKIIEHAQVEDVPMPSTVSADILEDNVIPPSVSESGSES